MVLTNAKVGAVDNEKRAAARERETRTKEEWGKAEGAEGMEEVVIYRIYMNTLLKVRQPCILMMQIIQFDF